MKMICDLWPCSDPMCDRDHSEVCELCSLPGELIEIEDNDRSVGYADVVKVCEDCIERRKR